MPITVTTTRGENIEEPHYPSERKRIAELEKRVQVLEEIVSKLTQSIPQFDRENLKVQMDYLMSRK